jgi:hypothetical protein
MDWMRGAVKSLLPLSEEKSDFKRAMKEWYYSGHPIDLDEPSADCELCGHRGIRYQFPIINRYNDSQLQIGSECINKFDIRAQDAAGRELSEEETSQLVTRGRNWLIQDAKFKRVINTLVELSTKDTEFHGMILSFIDQYRERGAFSPKQLSTSIWRLKKQGIAYHPSDFKMSMKKPKEKNDFFNLEIYQIESMQNCLTSSQKKAWVKNLDEKTGFGEFKNQITPLLPKGWGDGKKAS